MAVLTVVATFGLAVVLLSQPKPVAGEVDAMAGVGEWVRYRDPAGAFELELPAEPEVSAEEVTSEYRAIEISARVLRDTFLLERVDFTDGPTGGVAVESWLDEMPARAAQASGSRLQSSRRTTHAGLPGIEYLLVSDKASTRVTALLAGRRLFRFSVTAPSDPGAGFDRFVHSFVPVDPTTGRPVTTDG